MKNYLVLTVLSILISSTTYAQYKENSPNRSQSKSEKMNNTVQQGFAGYLTAGLGYSAYNSNLDVEGTPTSFKLLGSYVTTENTAVIDLGYGIQNQKFSQNAAIDNSISTGVLEFATRYQFESKWQLGAVANQFFNKGTNYGANQGDAQFGGVQLLREFSINGNYLARVGGRLMTSLNVDNESVNMALIDLQIGLGLPN